MREYGKVFCALWSSTDFRSLKEDGRSLVLYLLTCPHTTIAGAFRLPDGYITEDLQWSKERVQEGFADLQDRGFATRCPVTQWVWINKFLTWNPPENPNQWKAVHKVASQIPKDCLWLKDFCDAFPGELPQELGEKANPSETLSQPVAVTVVVTGTGSEARNVPQGGTDVSRETSDQKSDAVARVFGHWKTTYRHERAKLDAKRRRLIRAALDGYSEADLCQAISGYLNSPHHMGQNDRATVFDDIELFLRDAKHIDAGLAFYANPPRTDLSAQTRRIVAQTEDWTPPEARRANG